MVYAMYEYNPLRTRHHPARECKLRFWSIQKHQHHCFRTHMDAVSLKPMDVFAHYALTPPHFDQLPVRVGWPNGVFEWASHMYLLVYYFRCGYRWMVFFPSVVIVIFHLRSLRYFFLSSASLCWRQSVPIGARVADRKFLGCLDKCVIAGELHLAIYPVSSFLSRQLKATVVP